MKYEILSNNIDILFNYLSKEIGIKIDKSILDNLSINQSYFVEKVNIRKKLYKDEDGNNYVTLNENIGIKIMK